MVLHQSTLLNLTRPQPPTSERGGSKPIKSNTVISLKRDAKTGYTFKPSPVQVETEEKSKLYKSLKDGSQPINNSWNSGPPTTNGRTSKPKLRKDKSKSDWDAVSDEDGSSQTLSKSGIKVQIKKRPQSVAQPSTNGTAPASQDASRASINEMTVGLRNLLKIGGFNTLQQQYIQQKTPQPSQNQPQEFRSGILVVEHEQQPQSQAQNQHQKQRSSRNKRQQPQQKPEQLGQQQTPQPNHHHPQEFRTGIVQVENEQNPQTQTQKQRSPQNQRQESQQKAEQTGFAQLQSRQQKPQNLRQRQLPSQNHHQ